MMSASESSGSASPSTAPAIDKDRIIIHLYRRVKTLERILDQIDRDVQAAVGKYLKDWKPSFQGERVKFATFLGLLETEVTRKLQADWINVKDSRTRREIERRVLEDFERRMANDIPGNQLSVVVRIAREKDVETKAGTVRRPVYRASCLERELSIEGDHKDEAIRRWYSRFKHRTTKGPIARLPFPKEDLKTFFDQGETLDEDRIGIYTIVIKGYPVGG